MDPDGLAGVGSESTRVSLQARRVLVELKPTPKRAGSELDAVRAEGVRARCADESRRVDAAVISGRAQGPSVPIRAALKGIGPAGAGLPSSALRQCRRKLAAYWPLRHAPAPVGCGALPRLARFACRKDTDGLGGGRSVRQITRLKSHQARRVLVDVNPPQSERHRGSMRSARRAFARTAPMVLDARMQR